MAEKLKIIRTATVPTSLESFCRDQLKELSETYEVVAVSSPLPELEIVAQREGVRTEAVWMNRHISPIADLGSILKMYRLFRRERPWLVHSMTPKAGLVSMIAAWLARVPNRVHTFTGLIWPTSTGLKRRILMLTDRILCRCATHIIPEGNGVKSDLESHHITSKPMKVLAYGNVRGIDLEHYNLTQEVAEEANKIRTEGLFTFVFVGRIVGDKGIHELIAAFKRLNAKFCDTRLILVGRAEPELDPLNEETTSEIERNPAIEAVGEQADVRHWFAASDVLVFPSYREGFPNVVIEAGAMGLPSIVTDINGSNEIIIEGENGLIIPAHNSDALYEAMKNIYQDHNLRSLLSANARRLIAERFDCHIVRKALYEFYESLK